MNDQGIKDTSSGRVLRARAEAAAWITRLHGPNRSAEMEAGFRRWLVERPENATEFEGVSETWDLVGGTQSSRGVPRLERWEHSQESRELIALRAQVVRTSQPPTRNWVLAALVLLTCGILIAGGYRLWLAPSYSTQVGEQRIVQLDDNTRVYLNSNTRVVVAYRRSARRVYLTHGEAFFEVSRDPGRPFIVVAGEHQVTALGTAFVVRYEPDRMSVTLVEGKVSLATETESSLNPRTARGASQVTSEYWRDDPERPVSNRETVPIGGSEHRAATRGETSLVGGPIVLAPGQRLTLTPTSPPRLDVPRIEAVIAWRRGEVMLDDTPLAEAVAEMNRYDKTTITIDDPAIAKLTVSGLYHTGDSIGFAHSVARMYGLEVEEGGGRITIARRTH